MQHDATDHLRVEVSHAEHALARLGHRLALQALALQQEAHGRLAL
jgi:hypothetical protein